MASSLDSTNAPAPAPKPRRPRIPRWLFIVVGAITILLVVGWWTQRPLARIPLRDGGELVLVEARYASTYRAHSIGFRERLRHLLPDQWDTPLDDSEEEWDYSDEQPSLFLVFESHPADHQDPKSAEISRLTTGAIKSGLLVGYNSAGTYLEAKGTRYVVVLGCYPRRARQLHLCIVVEKDKQEVQIVYATIPNPAPITDAPRWTPEPMPQTRRLKSREVVLESLHLEPSVSNDPRTPASMYGDAEIKVHEQGVPDDAFETKFSLFDATGNAYQDFLPLSEPVWKVQVTVRVNDKYPFPSSNILSLGHATMPGPGAYRILPLRPRLHGYRPPGHPDGYRMVSRPHGHRTDRRVHSTTGGRRAIRARSQDQTFECVHPELIVLGWEMPLFQPSPPGFQQMWRLVIGNDVIPLPLAHSESSDTWRQGYRISYHGGDVLAGMDVEIQSILLPIETVDFFVQPPRR